jgi:hypothetical protein
MVSPGLEPAEGGLLVSKEIAQGKGFFRRILQLVSLTILCGLLVSCSSESEEPLDPTLEANCDRILSNLKTLQNRPEFLPPSDLLDSMLPGNLGSNSQTNAEAEILSKFPLLGDIIAGKDRGDQRTNFDSLYSSAIVLVQEALVGTDVDFPYDSAGVYAIATDPSGWDTAVQPLAETIFGESYSEGPPQGCEVVDAFKYGYDSENDTSVAFDRATDVFIDLARSLQVIRNCQVSGWHQDTECAEIDFVGEPLDSEPSDELTPEELEILEERKQEAENQNGGTGGSSGGKEAKPLQVCNAFGAVLYTEKYGKLTCTPVTVNKIKTLMWMK